MSGHLLRLSANCSPIVRMAGGCVPLLLAIIFLAGCAAPFSLHDSRPVADLQWPGPDFGPKVVWVRTITGYQDMGITKGLWKQALEFFTGADDRHIVRPHGVLFDSAGRLYIADPGGGVVHCMDIGAGRYTILGEGAASPLRSPIGLAEDGQGRIYISDSQAGKVFRHDPADGVLKPFFAERISRPTGITFNRVNGLLYIIDTAGQQVVAVDSEGHERFRFGSSGESAGQFNYPTDITADRAGRLYITDSLNYKIRIFTLVGGELGTFGAAGDAAGYLERPKGLAVDSAGHIYVVDSLLDAVQIFDESGRLLLTFGRQGTGPGEFWMPSGIYIDNRDYIFVADTYNQRIQVFRYAAETTAIPSPPANPVTERR